MGRYRFSDRGGEKFDDKFSILKTGNDIYFSLPICLSGTFPIKDGEGI